MAERTGDSEPDDQEQPQYIQLPGRCDRYRNHKDHER